VVVQRKQTLQKLKLLHRVEEASPAIVEETKTEKKPAE
jgi:hypothetical protein